jgi:hypothetical protein
VAVCHNEFDYPSGRIRPIPLQKRENIENIKLSREFIHRRRKNIVKETVQASFNEMIESLGFIKGDYEHNVNILEDNGFELDISKLQENIIGELEIESRDLLTIDDISGEEVNIEIDEERTEVLFRRLLWKHSRALGNNRDILFNVLRESIYEFFYDYIVRFMEDSDYIVKIQKLFVLNYRFFNKLIIDVINKYNELKEDDINEITVYTESVYKLPIKININPEVYEKVEIDKYFYNECYLQKDRSNPEKAFEEFIKTHLDDIEFWYKNGDNGTEYFSLVYELNGVKHSFYPDYIIKFTDGKIGIFETKDDNDDTEKTKAKAERLYKYIKSKNSEEKNIFGGIVANYGDEENIYIKINNKEEYTTNASDWIDLEGLI